jgi:PKD repeat protein
MQPKNGGIAMRFHLCVWILVSTFTFLPMVTVAQDQVVADFSVSHQTTVTPALFWFFNQSQGDIDTYHWDFGDGATSDLHSDAHTYAETGDYTVIMTITGAFGTEAISKIVKVRDELDARFKFSPSSTYPGVPMQFFDTSIGPVTEWVWFHDDQIFSRAQNPSLIFDDIGVHIVKLRANGPGGSDQISRYIYVSNPRAVAAFTSDQIDGLSPLEVRFTDTSTGQILNYFWDFGDGQESVVENPLHIYAAPGEYLVTHIVTGLLNSDITKSPVVVYADPVTVPRLEWSSVPGFGDDGVTPDRDHSHPEFEFRVAYTQAELQPPSPGYPRLLLDFSMDDSAPEPSVGTYVMEPVDADAGYQFSRDYVCSVQLVSMGTYRYRFEAECGDGLVAEGEPTEWMLGPVVELSDQPDLFLRRDEIFFGTESLPVYEGDPVLIHVPVYNRGGVAATCTVVADIWSSSGPTYCSSSTSVTVEPAGAALGFTIAKIQSHRPYSYPLSLDLYSYYISVRDVSPPDIKPYIPYVDVELWGNIVGTFVSDFTATRRNEGVELAWQSSKSEAEFHIEVREAGAELWDRITAVPLIAAGSELMFLDAEAERNSDLEYRLMGRVSDEDWQVLAWAHVARDASLPSKLTIGQWSPNPFNPSTELTYTLSRPGNVTLVIYDVSGRRVRELLNEAQGAGPRTVEWNGRNDAGQFASAGVYFARIRACGTAETRKLALVK